jgi:hypothetical protein
VVRHFHVDFARDLRHNQVMENTQTQETLKTAIQAALDTFGAGFGNATIQSNLVVIRDRKGRVMGNVNTAGIIDRKYDGQKALMGAPVRDKISAAIKAVNAAL